MTYKDKASYGSSPSCMLGVTLSHACACARALTHTHTHTHAHTHTCTHTHAHICAQILPLLHTHTYTHAHTHTHTHTHTCAGIACGKPCLQSTRQEIAAASTWCLEGCLLRGATHCNMLQHTATHCNTLQHTATQCDSPTWCLDGCLLRGAIYCNMLQCTATHCNTLQHTNKYLSFPKYIYILRIPICDVLKCAYCEVQHTATRCNTLQHAATRCNTLQHTVTLSLDVGKDAICEVQHTATHCNTLPHAATRCHTLTNISLSIYTCIMCIHILDVWKDAYGEVSMSPVTHMKESCRTCVNMSYHAYAGWLLRGVFLHVWMSHVTHMN